MLEIKDQFGVTISLSAFPKKIISLVPSQTELLADFGLNEEVTGITKFCVHPDSWFRSKTKIGGTKKLNIEKIKSLAPDLIIGNKEENSKEQIEELKRFFPVWMSDVKNLEQAYDMIYSLGEITGKSKVADTILSDIKEKFNEFNPGNFSEKKCSAAYFIWKKPWMCAGQDTFIHDMMKHAGWQNVFDQNQSRYPEITLEKLRDINPSYILLSSEPYPFRQKHSVELKKQFPDATIVLVDGQLFSWYGSRLRYFPDYFKLLMKNF